MLISTENTEDFWAKLLSLPSWERGLKPPPSPPTPPPPEVAPLVGAWIETCLPSGHSHNRLASLPSWERGLKL